MGKKQTMYRRPDGLYEKKVTLNGKRITFRGKTELEVFKKMAEYREEDSTGPKFSTVAEEWYTAQEMRFENGKLSFNTLKGYKPAKNDAIAYFNNVYVKQLQAQNCENYSKHLSGKYEGSHTIANKLSVLHLILDFACVKYNLPFNASDRITVPDGLMKKTRDIPSESDIAIIKDKIPQQGTDEFIGWLFCYTALYTGARRGEIVPMRIGWNVDVNKSLIHITKSTYFDGNVPFEKCTKSIKGVRDIVMLDDYKTQIKSLKLKNNDLLFTWHGKMITAKRLETCLNKYYKWAKIKATPHQCRHGFITICFEAGIEPKIIQEMAGHAQLSTTMDIYTHLRKYQLDTTRDKLNGIDFSTGKQKEDKNDRQA